MELNDVDELSVERLDDIVNEYLKDAKEEKLHDKGWPTQTCAYTISKAAMNAYTRIMANVGHEHDMPRVTIVRKQNTTTERIVDSRA